MLLSMYKVLGENKKKINLGNNYCYPSFRYIPPGLELDIQYAAFFIRKGGREQDMNIYMYLLILSKGNAGRIGQK